jgi:transcriptional regulator GlxA family with amidase domain
LLAKDEQPVTTMSGVQVVPTNSYRKFAGPFDTLIVPGGENSQEAMKDANLIECICSYSKNVRRLASVCTGAFLLAKSGVLDGHRATTHWYFSSSFKDAFPLVRLEPDQIFVHDGTIWSSDGVTSGIDLALAMVDEDWGHQLALYIARFRVVFMKRSGGQSQFSPYLETAATDLAVNAGSTASI